MTTEEKAKAYDKALERAKMILCNVCEGSASANDIETIFPELGEARDERIRKEIIHYILYKAKGVSEEQEHEWVTYLEKHKEQKEQKPNIELIQKSWYMEGYHDCEFNKEPKWIIKTGEGGPRYEENPKYGQHIEEKPVDYEAELKKCKDNPLYFYDKYVSIKMKPAEWSKEDKQALERAIDCVRSWEIDYCDGDNKTSERLKSLSPQPKYEWSEEDEEMRDYIIHVLTNSTYSEEGPAIYAKEIDWLKALRPSWKPSEEQMKALEKAIIKVHSADEIPILTELRQQLKKLM